MKNNPSKDLSLSAVRKVLQSDLDEPALLDLVDKIIGSTIVLAPVAFGPAGLPALGLLGAKNEITAAVKAVINKIAGKGSEDSITRHRRVRSAYVLVTFTSFFEALECAAPEIANLLGLGRVDRLGLTKKAAALIKERREESKLPNDKEQQEIAIQPPHPALGVEDDDNFRLSLYKEMTRSFAIVVYDLTEWTDAPLNAKSAVSAILDQLPQLALEAFYSQYFTFAVDFPEFWAWANLKGHDQAQRAIQQLTGRVAEHVALLQQSRDTLDLGLRALLELIELLPRSAKDNEGQTVALELHERYQATILKPVIRIKPSEKADIVYPPKVDIYVPQAYKVVKYVEHATRLEDEHLWSSLRSQNDLGVFILNYLQSEYSIETPLLILGHPGSGKSLLTEIIAARLAPRIFSVVRVELRDVDADEEVDVQIERAIRLTIGRSIAWSDYATSATGGPPLVILDGLDELLQASGKTHANYLQRVMRFQEREAELSRPVRVIVTSRITLIDRSRVPADSTVIRLLEFDKPRIRRWVELWNNANIPYFQAAQVKPFELPNTPSILSLAEQPLLLLMLALYDSEGNQLHQHHGIDQTRLYYSLLRLFIEREHLKGENGDAFLEKSEADKKKLIAEDFRKLGVAALGMFNRQALHISRTDLDRDLAHFGLDIGNKTEEGRPLSAADLVFGSFFFVHESRTKELGGTAGHGSTAFEFLHNTFGEFLTADFIVRGVLRECDVAAKLRAMPELRSTLEEKLSVLSKNWYSCLMFTPLHTRPVIIEMLRQWFHHSMSQQDESNDALLSELREIVDRQIANILGGGEAPTSRYYTPYPHLPMLGQLAVYSLNLVLVRAVVDPQGFTWPLENDDDKMRSWDELTHLWRSWLSVESLSGLTAVISGTRTRHLIKWEATGTGTGVAHSSRLQAIVDVSNTLADDVMIGLAGIHAYDCGQDDNIGIDELMDRLSWRGVDVQLPFALREWWLDSRLVNPTTLDTLLSETENAPPIALGFLDVVRRAIVKESNLIRVRTHFTAIAPWEFPSMDKELAEAYIELYGRCEPRWINWIFRRIISRDSPSETNRNVRRHYRRYPYPTLGALLQDGIFARPLLRVAVAYWNLPAVRIFCSQLASTDLHLSSIEFGTTLLICRLAWRSSSLRLLENVLRSLEPRLDFDQLAEVRNDDVCELLDILAAPLAEPASVAQELAKAKLQKDIRRRNLQWMTSASSAVAIRLLRAIGERAGPYLARIAASTPLDINDLAIYAEYCRDQGYGVREMEFDSLDWLSQYLAGARSRLELSESARGALEWLIVAWEEQGDSDSTGTKSAHRSKRR
ncbi:MAG: ATP-binding protein [Acidobacteriaceae bacterium]|nr:ATP-binding protein [Acidobacteriaceae bacterium]